MRITLFFKENKGICEYDVKCTNKKNACKELVRNIGIEEQTNALEVYYKLYTSAPFTHAFILDHIKWEELRPMVLEMLMDKFDLKTENDNPPYNYLPELYKDSHYYSAAHNAEGCSVVCGADSLFCSQNGITIYEMEDIDSSIIETIDGSGSLDKLIREINFFEISDDKTSEYIKNRLFSIRCDLEALERALPYFELELKNEISNDTLEKIDELSETLKLNRFGEKFYGDMQNTIELAKSNTKAAKVLNLEFSGRKK